MHSCVSSLFKVFGLFSLISDDLPLKKLPPLQGWRDGVGMGQLRSKNTPIPLLTSPLKGEEPRQRKIIANQVSFYCC
ncbi:MAG: hypothetical protein A2075_17905 [Geobacteraceae bacterium GWC2_58_44]|nr:MAG: hypothetical protein A2075_17905 [Geobacteraceae bacterium GWC2_58_44]HBG05988.1 hypothetical protein [Geobacter sp.]